MKTCFKCGRSKPLAEFYRHAGMADGHLGKCKDCARRDVRKNYRARRDRYVEYEKRRWPQRKESERRRKQGSAYREYKRKWRIENQDKQQAHAAVAKALNNGSLTKKPCEHCGDSDSKGHHPDYSKPLDVVWLCNNYHRKEHSRLRGIAA